MMEMDFDLKDSLKWSWDSFRKRFTTTHLENHWPRGLLSLFLTQHFLVLFYDISIFAFEVYIKNSKSNTIT